MIKNIGRVKARAMILGYAQEDGEGLYSSVYAFRGDSHASNAARINHFGANAAYVFKDPVANGEVGLSVLNNLAESEGMQSTGGSIFSGFGASAFNEQIRHRVPGLDLRGTINRDRLGVRAEWVGASRRFDRGDMTFNNHAAKPQAYNLEANYSFADFTKPLSLAVGYGQTKML